MNDDDDDDDSWMYDLDQIKSEFPNGHLPRLLRMQHVGVPQRGVDTHCLHLRVL